MSPPTSPFRSSLWGYIIISLFQVACILPSIVIGILRFYLSQENKRRDKLQAEVQVPNNGIIETVDSEGGKVSRVVDNSQMDLTDRENLTL